MKRLDVSIIVGSRGRQREREMLQIQLGFGFLMKIFFLLFNVSIVMRRIIYFH